MAPNNQPEPEEKEIGDQEWLEILRIREDSSKHEIAVLTGKLLAMLDVQKHINQQVEQLRLEMSEEGNNLLALNDEMRELEQVLGIEPE